MDVVTLGAALSIMKKMPDTAASSAAAAEDAADRAEEAAQAAARSAQAAAESAQAAAQAKTAIDEADLDSKLDSIDTATSNGVTAVNNARENAIGVVDSKAQEVAGLKVNAEAVAMQALSKANNLENSFAEVESKTNILQQAVTQMQMLLSQKVYNVYFYNGSTLLDTVQVLQGGSASYTGATPQKTGVADPSVFEFTGWSPSPTNVQGNLSVYAQFRQTAAAWETPGFDVTGAYAVQWHYGLTMPQLSRGGLAASFTDPVPAEGASGIGSSPFDSIAPWNGMEIYVDANGTPQKYAAGMSLTENDILVKIPEFYYKVEKDTTKQMWTWAVSPTAKTGYEKHPGSGRYVGRYHTGGSSSGVYSRSGVSPLVNTSQTNFRTYSANKGTGWHMMDLATWSAIQLLYLVEFADFDSQTVLGKGWNTGAIGAMGGTDSAAYHTIKATGAHNQYRWIEDPFSNCYDWIDGFVGSNNSDTYAAAKDSYAGGNSDLTALGFKLPSSGAIRGFGYSAAAPWAFIPDTASGTDYTTHVCDRVSSNSSLYPACVGGYCSGDANYGFFYFAAYNSASNAFGFLGSRLLKT